MSYKNGFFQLCHKEDGTYLKIFPAMNGGKALSVEDVTAYLDWKKVTEYDLKALNQVILTARKPMEYKLTSVISASQDEELKAWISEDHMMAVGRFYPPSSNGKFLEKQDIINSLNRIGVKYGILESNIDRYVKNRQFCTNIMLAKATPAVEGKSASIVYHFEVGASAKPRINEDGSVDFHQLDNISHVNKGDILATLEPADYGQPGTDVLGNVIKPQKVVNKALRHGKNIHLSEDGLIMYSDVSGHVSLTDDRVFVSDTYEVPADVSPSTGDIEYDGNVLVRGNVITGFTVKAKGDIIVEGVVEGATLIAGGQIVLKRGIQGMNRGILEAQGDIVTKFIENSVVTSGGNINTDAIMHSRVSAKGDVVVSGKRGLATGGEIKAGNMISVRTAGSMMGTSTVLEVGVDPELMNVFRDLEKEIDELKEEREKAAQTLNLFKRKLGKGEKLPQDKLLMLKAANSSYNSLDTKIEEKLAEYLSFKEELDNQEGGRIRVEGVGYSGVKIVISNIVYYVKTEVQHCQFIRDRGDIRMLGI